MAWYRLDIGGIGLAACSGEWVLRADAMIFLFQLELNCQLTHLLQNPHLAYCSHLSESSTINVILQRRVLQFHDQIESMLWRNPINHPTVALNASGRSLLVVAELSWPKIGICGY